jgi:diaminohydroxyphosphoribosylaminopyrimidine deaminase/5-amino-6-(5-phosphoribosylamino)uracil reductase
MCDLLRSIVISVRLAILANSSDKLVKTKTPDLDAQFMDLALRLARRGVGSTSPNPSVGCVIVRHDLGHRIVGRGWTQPGGRPHAESQALDRAGVLARSATAYVTLEPCSHHGQTPPCSHALIEAGIARCVIAMEDPHAKVSGRGIQALKEASIEVTVGSHRQQASRINRGFLSCVQHGRPFITVKTATSLDGKIATSTGQSKWITGPAARAMGHALRARHDAILCAMGTVRSDDPALSCRLPGLGRMSPIRLVLDPRLEISSGSVLVKSARDIPLWLIVGPGTSPEAQNRLEQLGVKIIETDLNQRGRIDLTVLMQRLSGEGLTRILVEGGAQLSASFHTAGLIDEFVWFRAPFVIGGDGLSAIAGVSVENLINAARLNRTAILELGDDVMERYENFNRAGDQ